MDVRGKVIIQSIRSEPWAASVRVSVWLCVCGGAAGTGTLQQRTLLEPSPCRQTGTCQHSGGR